MNVAVVALNRFAVTEAHDDQLEDGTLLPDSYEHISAGVRI